MANPKVRYNEASYQVIADHSGLRDGETKAGQVCPSCEGGATKERSLSVSRRGHVLLWNCHRSSCNFRGSDGAPPGAESGGGKSRSRPSYVPTHPISQATLGFLATKFGITRQNLEHAGLRWTGDGDGQYERRVCYPIFGPDSRKRGENYRSYQDGVKPKSLVRLDEGAVGQSWYRFRRTSDILVVVEDQVSAIKLAPYYDSLALLGTNLSDAKGAEVQEEMGRYKHIYLCLDNDATYAAIKMQLDWRNKIPKMRVMGLEKDIKNMDDLEFDNFMGRLL